MEQADSLPKEINNPTAAELRGMKLGCWSFVGNYFRPRRAGYGPNEEIWLAVIGLLVLFALKRFGIA